MDAKTDNPLLRDLPLPAFEAIRPEHVEPALDRLLAEARSLISELQARDQPPTWDNLVVPLDRVQQRLERAWSPVRHLHAVMDSEPMRQAYSACLPKLTEFATELGQNRALFEAYQHIAAGPEYPQLKQARQKVIDNALRDFRLSGVDLDTQAQAEYKANSQELARLSNQFSQQVLDATQAWKKHITEAGQLSGLPASALDLARQNAEREGLEGWLLNLEFPSYLPVMTYADDRQLRFEMYQAYVTRASDQGPHAGRWDNTPLMAELLALRHAQAQLLGFANYAELSLARKMARSTDEVLGFLNDLARRSRPVAEAELQTLREFARQQDGREDLEAWDIAYYAEQLRQAEYDISQETLRPYFPAPRVLDGLFQVVGQLYGIEVTQSTDAETWHPDVRFFTIHDHDGALRGRFFIDLYARAGKRGGAWMDECVVRMQDQDGLRHPVAYLNCNFTPPVGDDPALLTHDEVTTLFHEFGHGLHHMLTQVDEPGVSGINGVAWDAVELPSQFMENWCWERQALDLFAAHYQTGEGLPEELFQRMQAARNFHAGLQMVRQLEFALFDFRLHMEFDPGVGARIEDTLAEVRGQVAVLQPPAFNRFANGFSHIFGGGYAAGYYSYKWAEVLSSDAFARFEEEGIFNRDTGRDFLRKVLERGGSRDAMQLFVDFRGREPRIDALLRHTGMAA